MAKYRKKPVVVDAIQYHPGYGSHARLDDFAGRENVVYDRLGNAFIKTLEGDMKISLGDYVIKGIQGEFYPCKPDIFEATYEIFRQEDSELINPNDYDVVFCVDGQKGRLFEYGEDTTGFVKEVRLSLVAGSRAELTVRRGVASKDVIERLENE